MIERQAITVKARSRENKNRGDRKIYLCRRGWIIISVCRSRTTLGCYLSGACLFACERVVNHLLYLFDGEFRDVRNLAHN